jgi:hypothetical protein
MSALVDREPGHGQGCAALIVIMLGCDVTAASARRYLEAAVNRELTSEPVPVSPVEPTDDLLWESAVTGRVRQRMDHPPGPSASQETSRHQELQL